MTRRRTSQSGATDERPRTYRDRQRELLREAPVYVQPRSPGGALVVQLMACGMAVPDLCVALVVSRVMLREIIDGKRGLLPWQARWLEQTVPEMWEVHCERV